MIEIKKTMSYALLTVCLLSNIIANASELNVTKLNNKINYIQNVSTVDNDTLKVYEDVIVDYFEKLNVINGNDSNLILVMCQKDIIDSCKYKKTKLTKNKDNFSIQFYSSLNYLKERDLDFKDDIAYQVKSYVKMDIYDGFRDREDEMVLKVEHRLCFSENCKHYIRDMYIEKKESIIQVDENISTLAYWY